MIPPNLRRVMETLLRRSEQGRIDWSISGTDKQGGHVFLTTLTSGSVAIKSRDGDGLPPYELVLFDSEGTEMDRFTQSPPGGRGPSVSWEPTAAEIEEADEARLFLNLYHAARRQALDVNTLINAIGEELDR